AKNADILFIPRGYLHGFQSLDDDVEILYLHDGLYSPNSEFRINPLDPSINIFWPNPVELVSERDLAAPPVGEDFEGLRI
ncbi:dTDP-4-dehydrorhamnose 3,5-epimerase, partial [Pontimonas sp.]